MKALLIFFQQEFSLTLERERKVFLTLSILQEQASCHSVELNEKKAVVVMVFFDARPNTALELLKVINNQRDQNLSLDNLCMHLGKIHQILALKPWVFLQL